MKNRSIETHLLSYLTIRKLIGILGLLIPFLMSIGGLLGGTPELLGTISNYYYTHMRDLFVGVLCAVGLFLVSYKGYEPVDHAASNIAGFAALGVAFFPMSLKDPVHQFSGVLQLPDAVSGNIHLACAALFFAAIAFMSLFLFTKSRGRMTPRKILRNKIYTACGIVILSCLALLALLTFVPVPALTPIRPLFILETLALFAFGFSWLVKGETVLRDKKAG